ncbi:hypothetical protein FRC12_008805 [Ceratobasidium sp. 428]|nr:hypothetical protein FRC12_008805 [Ceratobasidium sp. 428]
MRLTLEYITNKENTNATRVRDWDNLESVEGDDTDKHHGEDEEGPCRSECFNVVGFVEPDHEHGEAHANSKDDIDPEELVDEPRVYDANRNSILDCADYDCSERKHTQRNENTLHGVEKQAQGLFTIHCEKLLV